MTNTFTHPFSYYRQFRDSKQSSTPQGGNTKNLEETPEARGEHAVAHTPPTVFGCGYLASMDVVGCGWMVCNFVSVLYSTVIGFAYYH